MSQTVAMIILLVGFVYILLYMVGVYRVRKISDPTLGDIYALQRLSMLGWVAASVDVHGLTVGTWDYTSKAHLWSKRRDVVLNFIKRCKPCECLFAIWLVPHI